MGGSHSSRTLTIDNDSDPTMIKVSESVVKRLRGKTEGSPSDQEPSKMKSPPPANAVEHRENVSQPNFTYAPYISSLDIRKEVNKELDKNNEYWEKRLLQYQNHTENLGSTLENEYETSLKELEALMPKYIPRNATTPCEDKKIAVEKCYVNNKKLPLNCYIEVQSFLDCMSKASRKQLSNKG